MQDIWDVSVVKSKDVVPEEWRVEALWTDDDGGVHVTLFSGPDAQDRAFEYASWKYDHIASRDTD